MLDIKEKRHITVVGRGGASNIDWEDIENKPDFATVATSGSYNDLTDKPEIPGQVNADWDATSGVAQILNKPNLATVATSGSYNDLSDKPDLTHYVEDTDLATVATSGSYNDLSDKPTIPSAQVNADWNASSGVQQILNKPTLATVATTGSYNDLTDKPDLTHYVEDTDLATVATSGSYNDLSDKPTIPSAQVNADWNASSGVQQILNKPTLATVATTGSYNDLTDKPTVTQEQADWNQTDTTAVDYIKNKPEIPSVPAMATQELTFTFEGGTTKTIEFYTVPNYFYVEDVSGSDNTLSITKNTQYAPTIEVFSSTDKVNWTSIGTTSTTAITATIPSNGKLYLKANTHKWASYGGNDANIITASGTHNVGGNIMSLLYGDDFENKTGFLTEKNIFPLLFVNNNKLINANKLILPATTLVYGCYDGMFQNCTSLTTAPELPATTLADYCYQGMFQNCTSLTAAPALPATTLVYGCYQYMFENCTSLTTAPELPATTLASYCYQSMFQGCTSLTTAPALPATTLTQGCYQGMFQGCTSLTTAPELPATTLASFCYSNMFTNCRSLNKVTTYATDISEYNCLFSWLQKVAATGDFFNLGNPAPTYPSGASGIPSGWTVHTSL